jgi:hypothetical protein
MGILRQDKAPYLRLRLRAPLPPQNVPEYSFESGPTTPDSEAGLLSVFYTTTDNDTGEPTRRLLSRNPGRACLSHPYRSPCASASMRYSQEYLYIFHQGYSSSHLKIYDLRRRPTDPLTHSMLTMNQEAKVSHSRDFASLQPIRTHRDDRSQRYRFTDRCSGRVPLFRTRGDNVLN